MFRHIKLLIICVGLVVFGFASSAESSAFSSGRVLMGAAGTVPAAGGEIDFDAIVDAGGGADYTTLQGAEDALDGGNYRVYVKSGTSYTAGLTADSNGNTWFFEPGTDIDAAVTFSGDNIWVSFGNGSNIDALLTLSGASVGVEAENGFDVNGIVMSGNTGYFDGGGWGTLSDGATTVAALNVSGHDCIVRNARFDTTSGTSGESAIDVSGDRFQFIYLQVVDSEETGINIAGGADDGLILGCEFLDSDLSSILCNGFRTRMIGGHIVTNGDHGIEIGNTGDYSLVEAWVIEASSNDDIVTSSNGDECIITANRVLTGTITDGSTTATVADNDVD